MRYSHLEGICGGLPQRHERELLVRSLNAYVPVLRDRLNEEFMKDKWGQ